MKKSLILPLTAVAIVALTACNKSNTDVAKKLSELERQNREAVERQQQLERQLADQQLASERDAIERERMRIEDERAAMEEEKGAEAAAKQEALANREQELALREGRLEGLQTSLEDRQQNLEQRDQVLSGRELELAGREAIAEPLAEVPLTESLPVADYGMFYDSLGSYGSWFETPDYGYVWQPAAVRTVGWRPYVDGSWVCTNNGWTWLSNEPFGWACYHYGRWAQIRGRGWIWVPGDQWAPAWVCWRESGSHIGWAPLPPETLGWRDCSWDSSVETRFGISAGWFNFVAINHFSSPIRRHCLPVAQNGDFWRQTQNITNIRCRDRNVFVGGPRYQDICRSIGRPAPYYQLNLNHHQRPGRDLMAMRPQRSGNQLNIAAPDIHADWNAALRPTRVREKLQEIAIERPKPLAPEVVDHFRKKREQDSLQADQSLAQLGGREAFKQRRMQVLEANQREALAQQAAAKHSKTPQDPSTATKPQPGDPGPAQRPPGERGKGTEQPQPPVADAASPLSPDQALRPGRPNRLKPDVVATPQPGPASPDAGKEPSTAVRPEPVTPPAAVQTPPARPLKPGRPDRPKPDVVATPQPDPASPAAGKEPATAVGPEPVTPPAAVQPPPDTPRRPGRATRPIPAATQPVQPSPAERVKMPDQAQPPPTGPVQRQTEAAAQQKDQQAETQRQQSLEEARQRQTEAAAQQKDQQAAAQRQQALEEARQRQTEAAAQQKEQQAEALRQRQAEALNQQKLQAEAQRQRAAEEARQRQVEEANQRAQQAEAQRQRAAEDARQRQQEQMQRQQEQARQRQAEEANQQRAQQAEAQRQRAAEEARQRQQQEDRKKQDEDARQRQKPGR